MTAMLGMIARISPSGSAAAVARTISCNATNCNSSRTDRNRSAAAIAASVPGFAPGQPAEPMRMPIH
jgi:hypothetical protein